MKKAIQQAFSPLHAEEHTLETILNRTGPARISFLRPARTLLVAAILAAALTVTAFGADYVLNNREVFFFDTLEALTAQYSQAHPGNAVAVAIPSSAEESKDMETSAEYVERALSTGLFDEETVLDAGENGAQRWRTAQCYSDTYGDIVTEYRASPDFAGGIEQPGLLDWDLTALAKAMAPDTGGQLVTIIRDAGSKQPLCMKVHLGYTSDAGKRLTLNWVYDSTWDYGEPEYILNDAYDESELFTTDDGVDVLLLSYDGQVWASAYSGHRSVQFYTTAYTLGEMKELVNELGLSAALT
ncbi:hypothetical protein WMO24_06630 [Ruthenibacterium sp. CLA-JM-H11]|uniref:DUF4367 domain-containing protein n=1 Tax=Ruthenibacterium intestinale TaxID=3133163 RepID=A0ABV1GE26_9FIRM